MIFLELNVNISLFKLNPILYMLQMIPLGIINKENIPKYNYLMNNNNEFSITCQRTITSSQHY